MEEINITKKVYKKFLKTFDLLKIYDAYNPDYSQITKYLLLGINSKGVISDCIELKSMGGGCPQAPRIQTDEVTNAYIKLAKKDLTPAGLAKISKVNFEMDCNQKYLAYIGGSIQNFKIRSSVFVGINYKSELHGWKYKDQYYQKTSVKFMKVNII
jgi:hypothetical protein